MSLRFSASRVANDPVFPGMSRISAYIPRPGYGRLGTHNVPFFSRTVIITVKVSSLKRTKKNVNVQLKKISSAAGFRPRPQYLCPVFSRFNMLASLSAPDVWNMSVQPEPET
jgi:hypothetical protein